MNVQLPNGVVIEGVPDGTPKTAVMAKAAKAGLIDRKWVFENHPQALIPGAEDSNVAPRDTSVLDRVLGVGETALTLGTGATTGALGYAGGFVRGLGHEVASGGYGTTEGAQRVEEKALQGASQLTYAPRTPTGQRYVKDTSEAMAPMAAVAPLTPQLSAVRTPPVVQTAKGGAMVANEVFRHQTPFRQRVGRMIEAGSTDVETAKYKVTQPSTTGIPFQDTRFGKALGFGGPKVSKDRFATDAIKQGWDEGVIAAIKGSSKADKVKMLRMLSVMEQGKRNQKFAAINRPADVAGDLLARKVVEVKGANQRAGQQLDVVAKGLKGKQVNVSPAVDNFMAKLDDMGVTFDENMKPVYLGSDLEGVVGAQRIINNLVKRMRETKTPDAYDVHRLKRFIDEQVDYGKTERKLSGKTKSIIKSLRHDLDGILDSKFDQYKKVNDIYSDTITVLDEFNKVSGPNTNILGPNTDKALGTLARRLMSNYQSRVRLFDAINELERAAAKYGGGETLKLTGKGLGKDDLIMQALFVDELDRVFGPVARTSFQGQIDQGVRQAARATASREGAAGVVVDTAAKLAEKARGINQENAFKTMRDLLKEGLK